MSRLFASGAKAARLSLVDGLAGAVVRVRGAPLAVFDFTVRDGRIVAIDVHSDPVVMAELDLAVLTGSG